MKPTFLIVKDQEGVGNFLHALLSELLSEYQILEAKDGEEAVVLASLCSSDIVLMDIGLPKMNDIDEPGRIKEAAPRT